MKIANKKDAKTFQASDVCIAYEYRLKDKDLDATIIELNGRYPGKGRTVNEVCKEMAYIISGSGKIVVEGKTYKLEQGTSIIIDPGESYFWEGKLTMFMPCTPAWYPEQHKFVK